MQTIPAKTIVTKVKDSSWFGTDYNMNIYRGCCHGCIYCDSRSECYRISDFDTVRSKHDALAIIRNDLRSKLRTGVVGTGSMSDPYNPFEALECLTQNALQLVDAYGFGVSVATKSPLVARDIPVLKSIRRHSPVIVKITVTTADDGLCRKIESHVAPSGERFAALRRLADAGIFCGVLLMPVLPYINDTRDNIAGVVRRAAEAGARFVYASFGVTLRTNQRDYFYEQLDRLFPGIKDQYINRFGLDYRCASPDERELRDTFTQECKKAGLLYRMQDIIRAYKEGYTGTQLSLFE